jgi:hypothetical protein
MFIIQANAPYLFQWEAINRKQITRWQHVSQLKASSFYLLVKKSLLLKMQQLIRGTGNAIWWLTEPHSRIKYFLTFQSPRALSIIVKKHWPVCVPKAQA